MMDENVRLKAISALDDSMIELQKELYGLKSGCRKEERVLQAINECEAARNTLEKINR